MLSLEIVEEVMSALFLNLKPGSQKRPERTRARVACGAKCWAPAFALVLMIQCAYGQSSSTPSRAPTEGAKQKTLVVLGDSLAAGYGVDPTEAYPAVLQRLLDQAGFGYRVVNAGISGDTSAGAVRRVDWMLKRPVDVLLLQIGGNDGLRGQSPSALKTNLMTIIERTRAKHPEARIVLAGMKMPPNMGAYANQFEQAFIEVAQEQRVALIPFLLEGVGGVPEMNLPDGIHPTPDGHRRVANNVWAVLEPVLKRAPALPPPR
jgi:acyl-CoA thioesterase I